MPELQDTLQAFFLNLFTQAQVINARVRAFGCRISDELRRPCLVLHYHLLYAMENGKSFGLVTYRLEMGSIITTVIQAD